MMPRRLPPTREEPAEIEIAKLPQQVLITRYARCKALSINELVLRIYGGSFEWYGFTIASGERPECIADIGIPVNNVNVHTRTGISAESISLFSESLPPELAVNGWIHSHGSLESLEFSKTDEANHLTVLDFVGTLLKKPVSRREIRIRDILPVTLETLERGDEPRGSVWVVTDRPVSGARIFETVHGSFCYGIVVGDGGRHAQDIYYKTRGILTGTTGTGRKRARMLPVDFERVFTAEDMERLADEVRAKIRPAESILSGGPSGRYKGAAWR